MIKAVYYNRSSNELYFEDNPNYEDTNFLSLMDVTEDQMQFGEIRFSPILHITLETQKFLIHKATNIEYNRKRVLELIDQIRLEKLGERKDLSFDFSERSFDGDLKAKGNIRDCYQALCIIQSAPGVFPIRWKAFDNEYFSFTTFEQFENFYHTFLAFRFQFENKVNQDTFDLKDNLLLAQTLPEIQVIESNSFQIGEIAVGTE
ncbi:hypothetical protein ND856_18700 [Leptospira bandrabouensis]|uniref:hypothetical protein n=1 Tax=Leptospira bandrabouensis TaxID=2484903 RepID=UPI00223D008A|nr:hypothetical protein [Leptospira bandrabouensis]MCW7460147.1 hypothetical protein [Leptospira bandrabouensis]MCW7479336.1 hypothetical protein [Leptospira bandrabouensis]MCW7487018.1 hypothetical protein [Leptospira bandrabouensis]